MPTENYKVLAQADLGTTNLTTVYTAPTQAVVSSVVFANRGTQAVQVRLAVAIAGAADANAQTVVPFFFVPPNDALPFTAGMTLAPADQLRVQATTPNAVSVNVFGTEIL